MINMKMGSFGFLREIVRQYLGVRNMNKKIISFALVICLLISSFAVGSFAVNAANDADSEPVEAAGSQAAQSKIQGAAVLHCFNWSYNNIKSNLSAIKNAGYTAVQTSPVQPPKDYNSGWTDTDGQWWKLYQPIDISIANGNSWLGTKAQLQSLCTEADKYGIKVIVDIVANHMADNSLDRNGMDNVNSQVNSTIRSNSNYWHLDNLKTDDDNDRYKMTHGSIGNPDLNTGNTYIQNRVKQLCIDCINIGVDGFRFDAAKHIELPTDPKGASNFWPTVINGSKGSRTDLYYYGEILNYQGTDIENYTEYMSVTDHWSGEQVMYAANKNNVTRMADDHYYKDATADKSVLWCESHDTYMGNETKNVSNASIIKGWAIVGSRADATSLFFARPNSTMGAASSDTTWKSKAVTEVNKFKNFFDGLGESVSAENGCAYNERGTTGVVISRPAGGGSVSLTAKMMEDGTYKDQVGGGTFTVSNGKITGTVGSTGVAVVYNTTQNPVKPTEAPTTEAPSTAPVSKVLIGDVNGDGIISVYDATLIQRHASELITLTGDRFTAADASRDNLVSVYDATAVQRYAGEFTTGIEYCGTYV